MDADKGANYQEALKRYFSKITRLEGTTLKAPDEILAGKILTDGTIEMITKSKGAFYQIRLRENKLIGLLKINKTLQDRLQDFRKDGWINKKEIHKMIAEAL